MVDHPQGDELQPSDPAAAINADLPQREDMLAERPRWWPLWAIVALTGVELAGIWLSGMNRGYAVLATLSAVALGVLLMGLWFVLFSRLPGRVRAAGSAAALAALVAAVVLFRIEGVSGDFVPTLGWRFGKPQALALPNPNGAAERTNTAVDLTKTSSDDYPQFLGPERRATVSGVRLARDWNAQPPKLLWRQPIGKGWSSFAVVGDYAVTQEQRGDRELVVCYELASGATLWAHDDPQPYESVVAGDGPRATPTVDEGRVYTLGAHGLLNCLDGATGEVLWSHDIIAMFDVQELPQWGKSCSPLVVEDLVIVSAGGTDGKSLVAFRKQTGELVWTAGDDASGYSSPTLRVLHGVPQVLIFNRGSVASHEPATGQLLWEFPWPDGNPNVAQPVAIGDRQVFVSSGYGIGCSLLDIERDEAGEFSATERWHTRDLKTKFTNVVVRGEHIYGLDEGILACIAIEDGKRTWKRGRYGHGQVLLVDDLLLVQAESGDVVLVEAIPDEHRELTRFSPLRSKTWNNPVLVGNRLLVRNDQEAACFELPLAGDGE